MNQQPDKIFREKLQGYQRPVSPDVWKRIAERRPAGRRPFLWVRAAASILLLATAGVLISPLLKHKAAPVLTKSNEAAAPAEPSVAMHPQGDESLPMQKESSGHAQPSGVTPRPSRASAQSDTSGKRTFSPRSATAGNSETPLHARPGQDGQQVKSPDIADYISVPSPPPDAEKLQRKPVKIVFTAEEVNQKYLSKANEGHATSDSKQSSTLRDLLEKAQALKHNQDPLGEIRQKKNEILAMNFKKELHQSEKD